MNVQQFEKNFNLIHPLREALLKRDFNSDDYIFQVKYSVLELTPGEKEIIYQEVLPQRLGFSNIHWTEIYAIKTNVAKTAITDISSKMMGLIRHKVIKTDEDANFVIKT